MKRRGIDLLLIPVILIGLVILSVFTINCYNNKHKTFYGATDIFTTNNKIVYEDNNYLLIDENGLIGLSRINGEVVIPNQYNNINYFSVSDEYILLYEYVKNNENTLVFKTDGTYVDKYNYYININKDSYNNKKYYSYLKGNNTIILDSNLNNLCTIKNNGEIEIINDTIYIYSYESNNLFAYNLTGKKLNTYSYSVLLGNYLLLQNKKVTLLNLKTNEIKEYDKYEEILDYYIFSNKDSYYALDIKGNELKVSDNGAVIHDKYKVKKCDKGYQLVNSKGITVVKECSAGFNYDYLDKEIIIYKRMCDNDESCVPYGIVSTKNYKTINAYDYNIEGKYIVTFDQDFKKSIYDHNLDKVKIDYNCSNDFKYIDDDTYVCRNEIMSYLLNEKLNLLYQGDYITCNNHNLCVITNKNNNFVTLRNDIIIPNNNNDVNVVDDYIKSSYANKTTYIKFNTLKTNNFINISYNNNIDTKDINIEQLINDYQLNDIKELIYNNEEKFKKYAYITLINKELGNYTKYVLKGFKIVANNIDYIDMDILLNKLYTLKFIEDKSILKLDHAGEYDNYQNTITLAEKNESTIYHEFTHFIDFNSGYNSKVYNCNGALYDKDYILKNKRFDCKEVDDLTYSYFTEGGAESLSSRYYKYGNTSTYLIPTNIYNALGTIYGYSKIDEIFFKNNEYYDLYELMVNKSGITLDEYLEFIKLCNDNLNNVVNGDIVRIADTLITLYENYKQTNYQNDLVFSSIIYHMTSYSDLSDSLYSNRIESSNEAADIFLTNLAETIDTNMMPGYFKFTYLDNTLYTLLPGWSKSNGDEVLYLINYDYLNSKMIEYKKVG